MKKTNILSIFLNIVFALSLHAQSNTWSKHYDLHIGNDYATHAVPVEDGVVLQAVGFCDFNSRNCQAVLKLDLSGNIVPGWYHISISKSCQKTGMAC